MQRTRAFSSAPGVRTSAARPEQAASLRRMEAVANLLDTAFVLPGTNQRIGIDAIIGLVPGIGDVITTALSTYVIWEGRRLGVSRVGMTRMLANLAVHAVVGAVPLAGDAFVALFRVNQRNMKIVRAHVNRQAAAH